MTTEAVASGARVCQSFLGAKIHNPKDPAADLAAMLVQVIGAVFALMEEHQPVWSRLKGSNAVRLFGFQYGVGVEPIHVNVERMVASFRQGLVDLEPIWRQMLAAEQVDGLLPLVDCPMQIFRISDDLWAHVVYDAAVSFHRQILPQEHLLKALTPLYLGRTASFVLVTKGLTSHEAEDRIEILCQAFERHKPYLIEQWAGEGPRSPRAVSL
jgi:glucosylglycerate synthase